MAKILEIKYVTGLSTTKGMSGWWLGRKDAKKIEFPSAQSLSRLFHRVAYARRSGVSILIRRCSVCCLIRIPSHIPKKKREIFLETLEKRMRLH